MEDNGLQVPAPVSLAAWAAWRARQGTSQNVAKSLSLPLPDTECSRRAARIMTMMSVLGYQPWGLATDQRQNEWLRLWLWEW